MAATARPDGLLTCEQRSAKCDLGIVPPMQLALPAHVNTTPAVECARDLAADGGGRVGVAEMVDAPFDGVAEGEAAKKKRDRQHTKPRMGIVRMHALLYSKVGDLFHGENNFFPINLDIALHRGH